MTGDADHLAEIGRALYGEHWQAPLARDLGVNRESIRRWLNGSSPFGADHGAWRDLRAVLEGVRDRAQGLLAQLPPPSPRNAQKSPVQPKPDGASVAEGGQAAITFWRSSP